MESEFRVLKETKVAIVGLGLMGGSLALALRGKCEWVLGIDHDANTLRFAKQQEMVDFTEPAPGARFAAADVVVLALPVGAILTTIAALPGLHPGAALVLDLGSTKMEICQALDALPARFDVLGGHPMCGKEQLSIYNAEAGLYGGAMFALTRLGRTSEAGMALALKLVGAVGARELLIDAETHDGWVAGTSHFPYLLASVLAASTPEAFKPLVGPGWRSTARLAGTPPSMMLDVLQTNRANILAQVQGFKAALGLFEAALVDEDMAEVAALLAGAREQYARLK